MILGQRLRKFRKAKRITLIELGQQVGVSASTISKLERGLSRNTGIDVIRRIERAIGVNKGFLFE